MRAMNRRRDGRAVALAVAADGERERWERLMTASLAALLGSWSLLMMVLL